MRLACIRSLVASWLALAASALAQPSPQLGPAGIAAGPDGAMWFTEDTANTIGRITPDGAVRHFPIPTDQSSPGRITLGPDGAMWFVETNPGKIGRIAPNGVVTEFGLPTRDVTGITAGPDGALWIAEIRPQTIGRMTVDGSITEFRVPHVDEFGTIEDITAGPDGAMWFVQTEGGVGRITSDGTIRTYPPYVLLSGAIVTGPDEGLWFASCALFPRYACSMNRMATDGSITRFPIGAGVSSDARIALGSDRAIWFTERYSNAIGRITIDGVVSHFPLPNAASFPWGIAAGPDGALWFTEHDADRIGRITPLGQITEFAVSLPCGFPDQLCLQDGRFEVGVTWERPDGSGGRAHPVSLTADSGYFWFLEPDNVEVAVKVLDGCGVNGHVWFFGGGLTNLHTIVTLTNEVTGETRIYTNDAGVPFQPVTDTKAFESCGTSPQGMGDPEDAGAETDALAASSDPGGDCADSDSALCIGGRFLVEVSWETASGRSGLAHAVRLTAESGYFWFFDADNVELVVKMLDACAIADAHWFFGAGLTTVGVRIDVTDRSTGNVRTYTNRTGDAFPPVQDTVGFRCVPQAPV